MEITKTEIAELFKLAEEKIKLIECLGEGLTTPAVNQLRYVGFHLLRAETLTNNESINEELRKAKNHCQRAIYDAVECGIAHCLTEIKVFQEDYRLVEIPSIIPSYLEICKKAENAKIIISKFTKDSIADHCNNPNDQYSESTRILTELIDAVNLLNTSRIELNKKVRKNRINYFFSIAVLIVGILGIIIAIVKS